MDNLKLFSLMLVLRMICLFVVKSYFVPDEYWQSLEIAHKTVYDLGYITWEWKEAIRSFFYPFWIALVYKILQVLKLDYVDILVVLPRLIQVILSSVSDVYYWLWLQIMLSKSSVLYKQKLYWIYSMWVLCWFVNFCSSRTLTNTAELNFTTIALYYYPWNGNSEQNLSFLWFVGLACLARPTAAIQWTPLCIYDLISNTKPVRYFINTYINIICKVIFLSVVIDLLFYKKFVLTPLNFILYNGQYNVGVHYGIHSWFWYIVIGIPVVLGPIFILFYFVFYKISTCLTFCFYKHILKCDLTCNEMFRKVDILLCFTVVWTIFWYSIVPHKEFRFILPLVPIMFYLSSFIMDSQLLKYKFYKTIFILITLGTIVLNVFALLYLGLWHQIGPLNVISKLATIANENPKDSNFMFLMPCHSTPLYSHLHINVTTRILTCEPNLKNELNYKDESDLFFDTPLLWLDAYFSTKNNCSIPSHLIFFSNLKPILKSFLTHYNYTELHSIFHAHITQGHQSQYIEIFYVKKHENCFAS